MHKIYTNHQRRTHKHTTHTSKRAQYYTPGRPKVTTYRRHHLDVESTKHLCDASSQIIKYISTHKSLHCFEGEGEDVTYGEQKILTCTGYHVMPCLGISLQGCVLGTGVAPDVADVQCVPVDGLAARRSR